MNVFDIFILLLLLVGLICMGIMYSRFCKNTADKFVSKFKSRKKGGDE